MSQLDVEVRLLKALVEAYRTDADEVTVSRTDLGALIEEVAAVRRACQREHPR